LPPRWSAANWRSAGLRVHAILCIWWARIRYPSPAAKL